MGEVLGVEENPCHNGNNTNPAGDSRHNNASNWDKDDPPKKQGENLDRRNDKECPVPGDNGFVANQNGEDSDPPT